MKALLISMCLVTGLSGCFQTSASSSPDVTKACVSQAGVSGNVAIRQTGQAYAVTPGANVSEAQAQQINACLARSVQRDGRRPSGFFSFLRPRCTSVLVGGDGYCINGG